MNSLCKIVASSKLHRWAKGSLDVTALFRTGSRTLYTPAALGIDMYIFTREKTLQQFASGEEKFKMKMTEFAEEGSKHMIFTEDLKSIVHLVEDKEEDMELILAMMRKFNQQNRELRFGSFIFGPVIMRMYHHLGRPNEALAAFKDEQLAGIFDQLISYQILMDLLLITERYDDVIEVFQIIKDKQLQPHRYPRHVVVLLYAALYKMNTPESFKLATDTWKELKSSGHQPMRKATAFAAALALKHGAPHIALEMISTEFQQHYVTIRNIKVWALANLGRPDDVLPILRSVLGLDDPMGRKHTFCREIIEQVRESVSRTNEKEVHTEFDRIEKQLAMHDLIVDEPLDQYLCREIESARPNYNLNQKSQMLAGSYNRRSSTGPNNGGRYRFRPGLADMN